MVLTTKWPQSDDAWPAMPFEVHKDLGLAHHTKTQILKVTSWICLEQMDGVQAVSLTSRYSKAISW
jgi:hypothetical protein